MISTGVIEKDVKIVKLGIDVSVKSAYNIKSRWDMRLYILSKAALKFTKKISKKYLITQPKKEKQNLKRNTEEFQPVRLVLFWEKLSN